MDKMNSCINKMKTSEKNIHEIYGYHLGINELRSEVLRLHNKISILEQDKDKKTHLNTLEDLSTLNSMNLNNIISLHKSCIIV